MTPAAERFATLRRLFDAALDLAPDERVSFVRESTGNDHALGNELLRLLAADDGATTPSALVESEPRADGHPPVTTMPAIAGYTFLRCLGSGGMGTVWEAEQHRPSRRVALKMLSSALPGERARRRFEDEIEILARLHHPGIAQVLEAGNCGTGAQSSPWFAMELVEDPRPIDRHAREQALTVSQRLTLLTEVCEAVQFAHRCGVLHRDLKPANVLVDKHGRVKVIDFGIARLLDGNDHGLTRTGELLGTLAYMSPERIDGGAAAVDVGSDVYALGVMLYELLTGQPPFAFDGVAPGRAIDVLRRHEPPPPSDLVPGLPRELDWITATATAREPHRRYATVAELLADLGRMTRNEPLLAGPVSATYRLRKLARRHRLILTVTSVVLLALLAGLTIAFAGWRRVAAAERRTRAESTTLAAVNSFQERILRGAYGDARGADVKLADVITHAANDLDRQVFTDPGIEIGMRNAIGSSYLGLGMLDAAVTPLSMARKLVADHGIAADAPIVAAIANNLGLCYEAQGRLELAERELRDALLARCASLGENDAETALAAQNMVSVLLKLGRPAEALTHAETALRTFERLRGPDDVASIVARGSMAKALADVGRMAEASATFDAAFVAAQEHLDPHHPARLALLNDRGIHLRRMGRIDDYVTAMQELASARERVLGTTHPSTLAALNNVAVGQQDRQDFIAAEATLRRIVAARTEAGIDGGFDVIATGQNLTGVLRRQGKLADALPNAQAMVVLAERTLPTGHWLTGVVHKELGACLRETGELTAAEHELQLGFTMLEQAVGVADTRTQKVIDELVLLYDTWQRPTERAIWIGKQLPAHR